MLGWYLIHTKPAGELVAQSNLERQGYEVYFPRLLQPLRRRTRWTEVVVALFPRYQFLRLSGGLQSLGPVRSTIGVANIVRFGSSCAVVPDRVVSDLRSRADPTCGLHRLSGRLPFSVGARIRVSVGPFTGLEGIFQREVGAERVVVLLELLGRAAEVCVPSGYVLPSLTV
jgi:transcriptional antiterminator RfaH